MFTESEITQKEIAYNYSKSRFENTDNFLNNKTKIFCDKIPNYSYVFITIARFISYKEDIWIKNKLSKNIYTNFSKEILDDFIFKGKFTTTKIHFYESKKQIKLSVTPIEINNILSGKENDSIWVIDNIRDSITHGHYYIDFKNESIVIKNEQPDRLLNCSIKFDLFFGLNELITEERIGGYTDKKLTTPPIIHSEYEITKKVITNIKDENELKHLLKNKFIISYSQVTDSFETDDKQKYKDLTNFYNYHIRTAESIFRNYQGKINASVSNHYINKMSAYAKDIMKNYNIKIFSNHLNDEIINRVVECIKEKPNFYSKNMNDQGLILQQILKYIISNEEITIERGVTDFVELYTQSALKHETKNEDDIEKLNNLIFSNINAFTENKKLANLFILAINNFVSNKETIYDKYFNDYDEFDISNFIYQDYSGYNKLINTLKIKNNELNTLNNTLTKSLSKRNKFSNNLLNAPETKKIIIQNNIDQISNMINDLNSKINNLIFEINDITNELSLHKNDSNGNYINHNNKNFFNHLRNAFAHNNIKYFDDRITYNRKIILEDYDDDKNLTFRCICRYYDLVKLINNDLFLQAITEYKNDDKIKQLEKI